VLSTVQAVELSAPAAVPSVQAAVLPAVSVPAVVSFVPVAAVAAQGILQGKTADSLPEPVPLTPSYFDYYNLYTISDSFLHNISYNTL